MASYMCWKMLEITCKKKQIFGQAFSKGFRDGISWYLADLSKAHGKQEGKPLLKDRDQEEVRGYRDALRFIHEKAAGELHN